MLKIFLSSTFRDLADPRSKILDKLDAVFEGVGMEKFIPDGSSSQEVAIHNLKDSEVVIFLISPYYGSLIDDCSLKNECKAECPMKTGKGQISFTHCEYKTVISEGILHQTYVIEEGWDANGVNKKAREFRDELGKEMWKSIQDLNDTSILEIRNNLAKKIVEWHTKDKLDFKQFCNREKPFNELIKNIDGKVEVYGVGGIGKTALIQVALLIQKLKGKKIISIGIPKAYASGSGFESFRLKCKDDQYIADSQDEITIYDIINALVKTKLISNQEEILKKPKEELVEFLSKQIRKEENLIVFIDDFHLATDDIVNLAKTLDNIILSSRKNTYVAKKEICILGIDEEDREDLINLYTTTELPIKAKEKIKHIAEGHPLATEILVKNYQKINFNNLTSFDPENVNDEQVKEFYQRVIEEIFSTNPQALTLLKDLAILNTDLESNINREVVYQLSDIYNSLKYFNVLVDTGMLKKREGKEATYEFCYIHIKDALENIIDIESHKKAIKYYEKKRASIGENIDDLVEILYHKVKSNPTDELVYEFIEMLDDISPVHYAFKRIVNVGENLKDLVEERSKLYLLVSLGSFYRLLGRFEEAELAYQDAHIIGVEMDRKYPETIIPNLAMTQNNLGNLYSDLERFEEAENAYKKALEKFKELDEKIPIVYKSSVASMQNNLGMLYSDLDRFDEAENAYEEALEIYEELAKISSNTYNADVADIKNNFGTLLTTLGRFEEAELVYQEVLDMLKELVRENPDKYKLNMATTQNNLGRLYIKLRKFKKAETLMQEAVYIIIELAEKNPDVYKIDVALAYNSLGTLYSDMDRFEKAETSYNQALEILKELVVNNPDVYMSDFANTYNNLGILYRLIGRFDEAETAYLKALNIFIELARKNPNAHKSDVAITQLNLGSLYFKMERFEEAETTYQEALVIFKELAEKNPDAYKPNIAKAQNNLGVLYSTLAEYDNKPGELFTDLDNYKKAENMYQDGIEIFEEITKINPDAYKPDLARTWYLLGNLYMDLAHPRNVGLFTRDIFKLEEAETAYLESIKMFKELVQQDPDKYKVDVAMVQFKLGNLYFGLKRYKDAETVYQKLLEIDPKNYSAWYLKACIESIGNSKEKSIESLKRAIELNKAYLELAKSDKHFDNIRKSQEFKKLIGE